jgi:hypothetical protein
MARVRSLPNILHLLIALALLLGAAAIPAVQPAAAAAPELRCESIFSRAGTVRNATGVFASNNGRQGSIPPLNTSGFSCPAAVVDTGWSMYYGLDKYVSTRTSEISTINGVTHYTYNVVHERRDCACTTFTVVGREEWTLWVPYHLVPRLSTNSGVLSDSLYVTTNGTRYKLADLKLRLAFVEDPIKKLQRGYFSEVSVIMNPGTPTTWTYTKTKKEGDACGSYPETVGGQEVWYLRCDVDVTFVDPTKRTTSAELTIGGEAGRQNSKAVGEFKIVQGNETQGTYVYYKAQIKIALGITWHQLVRRVGTCQQTSLSYVISTLNPYVSYVDIKESYAVHGGRCRFNSSNEYY